MGSTRKSMTSMTDTAAENATGDDYGNSDQFLRRKVRGAWKELIAAFKHEADAEGNLSPQQLRDVLFRFDIIMADRQFTELVATMDEDGDGKVSKGEFLAGGMHQGRGAQHFSRRIKLEGIVQVPFRREEASH